MAKTLDEDALNSKEVALINEVYDLVTESNGIVYSDDIKNSILSKFNENSKKLLTSNASPLSTIINSASIQTQIKCADLAYFVSKMLYSQSSGDDLSLAAANFGYERIEAKSSTMNISVSVDKDLTLDAGTSFTDGGGTIWLSQKKTEIAKNTTATIALQSRDKGVINFLSPLNPTNAIAGISSIEVDTKSIVIGKGQESDSELRETIASGIAVQGADNTCKRALLSLSNVNSAFVVTNPFTEPITQMNVKIDSRMRYVSLRLSNPDLSAEEADLIAQTINQNSNFNPNYQLPADKKVKYFFGIEESMVTKPKEEGGAGLAGVDIASNCILVRTNEIYGNFIDVYFYIAQPTKIDVLLNISYIGNYSNVAKENLNGKIKATIAQIISEIAQVGSPILTSAISSRYYQTELKDQAEIVSCWVRQHGSKDQVQNLNAKSYEYFELYDDPAKPYAGVIVSETNS